MKRTTSLPDSALDSEESEKKYAERGDSKQEVDRRRGACADWESDSREMKSARGRAEQRLPHSGRSQYGEQTPAIRQKPIPPPKPELTRRRSEEGAAPRRQLETAEDASRAAGLTQTTRTRGRCRGTRQREGGDAIAPDINIFVLARYLSYKADYQKGDP